MTKFEITERLPLNRTPKSLLPRFMKQTKYWAFCEKCGSYGCEACEYRGFRLKYINED